MMVKRLPLIAFISLIILDGTRAGCDDCATSVGSAIKSGSSPTLIAAGLLDEIEIWLASNFDLPTTKEHPAVAIVSQAQLVAKRLQQSSPSEGAAHATAHADPTQRRVVALYDDRARTIFLADDWIGTSPADRSILVHEMVHHIQNLAGIKYECPMAREKPAYLAQDKWLGQFGLSLEKEFDVDMFTVVVSLVCAS
jgi:Domain of unknown function (DUF6647)